MTSDASPSSANFPSANSAPVPGTPPDAQQLSQAIIELSETIATLRGPDGCPWDKAQTMKTIKPYTLEETYELLDAIDADDNAAICEELGDVLLQVVLDAQIAADEGRFNLIPVVQQLNEKMIRRHPHVFGNTNAETPDQVRTAWDQIKAQEKSDAKQKRESILDGLPKDLPGLAKSARLQGKAAKVGYDFPQREMLFDKLEEELDELKVELFGSADVELPAVDCEVPHCEDVPVEDAERRDRIEAELGDVLFVIANIARRWKINPEEAIRRTSRKFTKRFQAIERGLQNDGKDIQTASLADMEVYYTKEKQREKQQQNDSPESQS